MLSDFSLDSSQGLSLSQRLKKEALEDRLSLLVKNYQDLTKAYNREQSPTRKNQFQLDINETLAEIESIEKDIKELTISVVDIKSRQNLEGKTLSIAGEIVQQPSEYDLSLYADNSYSVHLVIAIYWKGKNHQQVYLDYKICYRNLRELKIETIKSENIVCDVQDISDEIENLCDSTAEIIEEKIISNDLEDWDLVIEIFLPIELLCRPLFEICGENNNFDSLLNQHPIVFGCSDLFNPGMKKRSLYRKNLRNGWKRFCQNLDNLNTTPLSKLDWLKSYETGQKIPSKFSAFQCYGDWLCEQEDYIDKWMQLIISGMPLALWISGSAAKHPEIQYVFDEIEKHSLTDFIGEIKVTRELQCNSDNSSAGCLGVFFEDPNYLPATPDFLAWES